MTSWNAGRLVVHRVGKQGPGSSASTITSSDNKMFHFPTHKTAVRYPKTIPKGKKVKVLHFIDSGGLYGAEKVILLLAGEMKRTSRYEPVIGCIVQDGDEGVALFDAARDVGLEAYKLVINNKRIPIDLWRVGRFLRRQEIAIIHSHGYKPTVFGYMFWRLAGISVTTTCHLWYMRSNPPLKCRIMTSLEKQVLKSLPHVVTVSEPLRDYLISLRVSPQKVSVIRNGIKMHSGFEARERRIPRSGSGGREYVILNVARLSEQKAQENIIHAARFIKGKGKKIKVQIVGEGYLRSKLKKVIAENDLQQEVKLLGFRNDVHDLMRSADLFVLPSHDEGLPMSMLEAMACRLPVLVTPVGEIPKIIKNGENGIVVPKNDVAALTEAILWSMENRCKLEEMSGEAFSVVRRTYSSEMMNQEYESIYDSIMMKCT